MTIPAKTYLYMSDLFKPLPYTFTELLEAWEEDKLKPFELVRRYVEEELGEIKDVKLYGAYFNPETMTAVIEYMVTFEGEKRSRVHGVKIIHTKTPTKQY